MKRTPYYMPSSPIMSMKIGRLQTLQTIPVCAGDSIDLQSQIVARLSPLRRESTLSPQIRVDRADPRLGSSGTCKRMVYLFRYPNRP